MPMIPSYLFQIWKEIQLGNEFHWGIELKQTEEMNTRGDRERIKEAKKADIVEEELKCW